MRTLTKACLIALAVIALTLGLVILAPVILVGLADGTYKAGQ